MLNALPLKHRGLLHGEVPATEKTIFFEQKVNGQNIWLEKPNSDQIQKLVAWGANSVSSDLEKSTVFLVNNSEPQPRALGHAVLKGGVVMNEGLLEAELAVFSIGFCKPAVKEKMKIHFSPELCEKKSNAHFFYRITAAEAQTHGKLLRWHRRTWCCVWNQRRTLSKKRTNCQNWQRDLGHVVV